MKSQISFISGHAPPEEEIQFTIGPYHIFRSIAKGGMGQVYLAYDTQFGRKIALKKIRTDLVEHKKMHNRFLNEARITSQLTHPAIIPIYTIHDTNQDLYYTMPFIEGETLKEILYEAYKKEKKGQVTNHIGTIPSLLRIFLQVCQAIAYAHSHQVIHRDIKPENVIVGPYGEVFILDWGLAKIAGTEAEEESCVSHQPKHSFQLTHIGKVVGTIAYMAPERAQGNPANVKADIYSLGVILYQILTLHLPFHRGTLQEFRKTMHKEVLPNPAEVAPYREVPASLTHIVSKCLERNPYERFDSVDELISALENYIEGRSSWFVAAELNVKCKQDWEFQENVFLADHIAITRGTEESDWVSLMVSKSSFAANIKIEAAVHIGAEGHGIGILLNLPESAERTHLNEGYCLWLGSDLNKTTKLTRSGVEVIHAPEIYLQREVPYQVRLEKIDHNIHFYLNDMLQFSYISHLPFAGTHIGIISRDDEFTIDPLHLFVSSQNISVSCLAIPDAFLAHKDYVTALNEYRRIGYSFPDRQEGREAIFRAGITLLEQAKTSDDFEKREKLFNLALEEFEKLHKTPGAPLEYLGKALVYRLLKEYEEETKCFALAYRRYPHHPLLHILQEQIIYRMHECSRSHRNATYHFILLVVQYLPKMVASLQTKRLFKRLQKHWEKLPFIEKDPLAKTSKPLQKIEFGIKLSFWLAKPYVLVELINGLIKRQKRSAILITEALFCLIVLGAWELADKQMQHLLKHTNDSTIKDKCSYLTHAFHYLRKKNPYFPKEESLTKDGERVCFYIIEDALKQKNFSLMHQMFDCLAPKRLSDEATLTLDCYLIWGALLERDWERAGKILYKYPVQQLNQETSLLYFLYGCWLYVTEGKEIAAFHFSEILSVPYPRTWTLCSHYLYGKLSDTPIWLERAFMWERRKLWQQLTLFYHCAGDEAQAKAARDREQQEYLHITD